jgi:hypothetical protein
MASRCALLMLLALPAIAAAQEPRWQVEVHGGGVVSSNPSGGQGALPAPGAPFDTPGGPSRRVASWYFGDGASLMNEFLAMRPAIGDRIVPLDQVLTARLFDRRSGTAFGARLSRSISRRLDVEFNVDVSNSGSGVRQDARAGIEASRASFARVWDAVFVDGGPTFAAPQVSSTATVPGNSRQIGASGNLSINLLRQGVLVPYVTGGVGVISRVGDDSPVRLAGNYRFAAGGLFTLDETDTVVISDAPSKTTFVGVIGGGLRYYVTPRWGLRFDVRAQPGDRGNRTIVSTFPGTVQTPPVNAFVFSRTTPSLYISNQLDSPSTLSSSVKSFETFAGKSTVPVSLTAGYFWRF